MNRPCVIICERTSRWATAVSRHLPEGTRLVQTRGLAECAAELAESPASLLALATAPKNLVDVLDFVGEASARFPLARVVILADGDLNAGEELLREGGAMHVVASPRELGGLARTIRNHFDRLPAIQADFAESIWDALPWDNAVAR